MSRKSRFASKERMAELRREGRVPVSALGIRLTLASLSLLLILPLLPKNGPSPIFTLFASNNSDVATSTTQSSWGWIVHLAFTHLSLAVLGSALLLLITVFPLALIQSKFFIAFTRLHRTFEVRDTRSAVLGRTFWLLIGFFLLLWLVGREGFSLWNELAKSEGEDALWRVLMQTSRTSVISCVGVFLFLGFLSAVVHQLWFRIVYNEADGRFRKTRE